MPTFWGVGQRILHLEWCLRVRKAVVGSFNVNVVHQKCLVFFVAFAASAIAFGPCVVGGCLVVVFAFEISWTTCYDMTLER